MSLWLGGQAEGNVLDFRVRESRRAVWVELVRFGTSWAKRGDHAPGTGHFHRRQLGVAPRWKRWRV